MRSAESRAWSRAFIAVVMSPFTVSLSVMCPSSLRTAAPR
jgi:hypothetical protein